MQNILTGGTVKGILDEYFQASCSGVTAEQSEIVANMFVKNFPLCQIH